MSEFDLSHILSLYLIYTEAYHQVRHYLCLFLSLANYPDSLVYIEQYQLESL